MSSDGAKRDSSPARGGEEPPSRALTDGRVTRAQRLREERRAQVLETASRLFAERGYHQTSISDIIEAADIARGTFYLYFESKRAIFGELLDRFFERVQAAVKRVDVSPGAPPPLLQMQQNVSRLLAVVAAERDMARVLLRGALGVDEEFDRKLGDFYSRVAALIEKGLRLGIDMGLVRPCDPSLCAWFVLGSAKEAIDRMLVSGGARTPRAESRALESLGRELMEFNLRGTFR